MHFFLEDFFFCFFSGSILCWRLTIGPSVASSSRGRVINIFVRNDSDILYAPDEGNNSVWPLVRHHQEEKKRTLWPKRVNRNAVAAATFAFVFFSVNLELLAEAKKSVVFPLPDNLICLWSSMILIRRYFKHLKTYLWCRRKLTLKTNDGASVRKCEEDFHKKQFFNWNSFYVSAFEFQSLFRVQNYQLCFS